MKYRILYSNENIGTSNLESQDRGMGIAHGVFTPTPAYEQVRPVFRLFSETLAQKDCGSNQEKLNEYYRLRDSLNLRVETSEGTYIPTEWVHIIDLSAETGDYEVEVKFSGSTLPI